MPGGDFFQSQIAADAAMRVEDKAKRNRSGVETAFALLATPRNNLCNAEKIVQQ
jgi:hypothetical protein